MTTKKENDHDVLIDLRRKVITLCGKVDNLDGKFDRREEGCITCKEGINGKIDFIASNKVPWVVFKWIGGGMSCGILIIITYLVVSGTQINTNKVNISHMQKTHHAEMIVESQ
jgi:hypothetical protein